MNEQLADLVADAAKGAQDYALGNSQFKLHQLGYETLWKVAEALRSAPAQQTRNEIIEECAKACEGRIKGTDGLPGGNEYGHYAPYNCEDLACAKAVRALSALPSTHRGDT